MSWQDDFRNDMLSNWSVPPVQFASGEGSWLVDIHGKRYLDFLAGIAVNALGHSHPVFVHALTQQAKKLSHVSNLFTNEPVLELAARLKRLAQTGDSGRVFFCNSGTEAIEAAFKLARRNKRNGTILSLTHSFHGRTMGALAVTGKPALQEPFEPMVPNVRQIEATLEALEGAIDDNTAAIFIEPIRGEAGVLPLPEGFLKLARKLTLRHNALLILDEIQTGIARTGEWFAFQGEGVVPDVMALAKGLGGGFPIGAVVTFGAAGELFKPGDHGTTFGGNALACAVANAVLEEIEDKHILDNVKAQSLKLSEAILNFESPLISGVRGKGLLLGITLTKPYAKVMVHLGLELGLVINAPDDDIVRLVPPLNLNNEDSDEFLTIFARILAETEQKALSL
ncbi:MAG: acetylornithine transaminase [Microbacteriaceae bacterium]